MYAIGAAVTTAATVGLKDLGPLLGSFRTVMYCTSRNKRGHEYGCLIWYIGDRCLFVSIFLVIFHST